MLAELLLHANMNYQVTRQRRLRQVNEKLEKKSSNLANVIQRDDIMTITGNVIEMALCM